MNAENRPPFVTGPRRCGRTEAMLNRIMENIRRVNFQCPDLSTWRLFARSTEEVRSVIFPRLLQKIEAADIKHRWCSDSSERILLEIIPYGPNILIGAMPPVLEQRKNTNVFYDHAATEWHLREMLWQLKEDIDTVACNAQNIQKHSRVKGYKEYFYGALEHSAANKTEGEWQLMPLDKEEIDGKTDDKDKKND